MTNLLDLNTALKKPNNISFYGSMLTQNNNLNGKNLSLIDYPVASLSGKLSFKITKHKKGSQIIIGVMSKPVYESMN